MIVDILTILAIEIKPVRFIWPRELAPVISFAFADEPKCSSRFLESITISPSRRQLPISKLTANFRGMLNGSRTLTKALIDAFTMDLFGRYLFSGNPCRIPNRMRREWANHQLPQARPIYRLSHPQLDFAESPPPLQLKDTPRVLREL